MQDSCNNADLECHAAVPFSYGVCKQDAEDLKQLNMCLRECTNNYDDMQLLHKKSIPQNNTKSCQYNI